MYSSCHGRTAQIAQVALIRTIPDHACVVPQFSSVFYSNSIAPGIRIIPSSHLIFD
jgi:hypothetical protein